MAGSALLSVARWAVLVVIFLAPWLYGGIPIWVQEWLTVALIVTTTIWIAGLAIRRRRPVLPRVLVWCVVLLLVQGWLLIGNAQFSYDRTKFEFVPADPFWSGRWVPGALDTLVALPTMLWITALLGALCMITDMARHPVWSRRVLGTMLVSGVALVIHGIAQRILRVPLLLWEPSDLVHNLFASFYYHGNAGAFVNLLVPGLIGFTALAFRKPEAHAARTAMVVSVMLALAASVAIASKAAMVVTPTLLVVSAFAFRHLIFGRRAFRGNGSWLALAGLVAVAMFSVSLFGMDRAVQRWGVLPKLLSWENPRLIAWQACLRILPDAGPWGIGPGNFRIAFPHYTHGLSSIGGTSGIAGIWEDAHQDYLQTCIEWGWFGCIIWGVVFGGALWRGARQTHPKARMWGMDDVVRTSAGIALAGVLMHGMVDFPLQIPSIQLYVAALLGILWSSSPSTVAL